VVDYSCGRETRGVCAHQSLVDFGSLAVPPGQVYVRGLAELFQAEGFREEIKDLVGNAGEGL